jgi:hypothetical protein
MRKLIILLALINIGAVPPQTITWNITGVTASYAQTYRYKLYINEESGKQSVVQLVNTLCGTVSGQTQCSTALPAIGNPAIISGNNSLLSATDANTNLESPMSIPFTGNQGCILRDNLYKIGTRTSLQANRPGLNPLLAEFKAAKFKHISTVPRGGQYTVTEECVGYIVQ